MFSVAIEVFSRAFFAVDPALGRLDYESLSDQALMEMLFDGLSAESKEEFQDKNGNFIEVSEWRGVYFFENRVRRILIFCKAFDVKQFPFQFMPALVVNFVMTKSRMRGTLDTSVLPRCLEGLIIDDNLLHGSLKFSALPQKIGVMNISRNAFSGSLVLEDLPDALREFNASYNKFSGEIELNKLPKAMRCLEAQQNSLTGSICIERLPDEMSLFRLGLRDNKFTGEIRVLDFPKVSFTIDAGGNPVCVTAVVGKIPGSVDFSLQCAGIFEVVDEAGRPHAYAKQILAQSASESDDEYYRDDYWY